MSQETPDLIGKDKIIEQLKIELKIRDGKIKRLKECAKINGQFICDLNKLTMDFWNKYSSPE